MKTKIRHMTRYQIVKLMRSKHIRGLDVGAAAGVSQATVVRVIARNDGVDDARRERVWQTLEEMLT